MEFSAIHNLLPFIFFLCGLTCGSVDYCKNHTIDNVMQNTLYFSKENSEREFAILDRFKSLHCCSHGYRSIEWFKDGIAYPWSTDVSTLIISPESGNQTIYSQVITDMDSGGYWCIVRNDTHSIRHDVFLKVTGTSNLEGPPKPTYRPKDQRVALGQNARFYCEAFVGNIDLPDAKSEVSWRKLNVNDSILQNERMMQEVIFREGNQVLGSYLFISDIRLQDYGIYICRISNTGDQFLDLNASLIQEDKLLYINYHSYPWGGTVIMIILLILSATLSTIYLVRFRSHFRLIYHQLIQKNYSKRLGEYDILLVYHSSDKYVALNKIMVPLQDHYRYSCTAQSISSEKSLNCKNLIVKSKCSKRLIVVLNSSLTDKQWSCQKLNVIMQNLISIHPRIITVFLKPLPSCDAEEHGATLRDLLSRVHNVEYSEKNVENFWELLTLGLPVPDFRPGYEQV